MTVCVLGSLEPAVAGFPKRGQECHSERGRRGEPAESLSVSDKSVTLSAAISEERAKSLSVSSTERFFVACSTTKLLRMTGCVPGSPGRMDRKAAQVRHPL